MESYTEHKGVTEPGKWTNYKITQSGQCCYDSNTFKQKQAWGSEDSTATIIVPDKSNCLTTLKKNHFHHKVTYVLSVLTLLALCLCMVNNLTILPYYYSISTPFLFIIRFIMYWKYKWQFFLIDFCYFTNTYLYIVLWALPQYSEACVVLFAVANGPLICATALYRNSMVFHDVDRMTSCYIHMLPSLISFGLRWFPEEMSRFWYIPFNVTYPKDISYLAIWLVAVPFATFVAHTLLYLLIIFVICRPGEKYWSSYRYMTEKKPDTWQGKILARFGQQYAVVLFLTINWLYCLLTLLPALLVYNFFIAHAIYIGLFLVIILANGASYYTDVFAKQGFTRNDT